MPQRRTWMRIAAVAETGRRVARNKEAARQRIVTTTIGRIVVAGGFNHGGNSGAASDRANTGSATVTAAAAQARALRSHRIRDPSLPLTTSHRPGGISAPAVGSHVGPVS